MKTWTVSCLLATALIASLSACSSVFDTKPGFGPYAEIDIAEISPGKPSVTIDRISRNGTGAEHGPFSGKFYLRPGEYLGVATCNRPVPEGDEVPAKIGTADAPYYNFNFPAAAGGTFTLDCRYGKDGEEFVLTGDRAPYNE